MGYLAVSMAASSNLDRNVFDDVISTAMTMGLPLAGRIDLDPFAVYGGDRAAFWVITRSTGSVTFKAAASARRWNRFSGRSGLLAAAALGVEIHQQAAKYPLSVAKALPGAACWKQAMTCPLQPGSCL